MLSCSALAATISPSSCATGPSRSKRRCAVRISTTGSTASRSGRSPFPTRRSRLVPAAGRSQPREEVRMFDFLTSFAGGLQGEAFWLPLIWSGLLAIAVAMYVIVDGFDLGVGILFTSARSESWRDRMMFSVAPVWDGNETWLILGGGGLLAVFYLAYVILLPALYMPLLIMLIALIFRGVAFEFRFKADTSKRIWDYSFHYGSLLATFSQGMVLGAFVQGFTVVNGRQFGGGTFDWLTPFS